MLYNALHTPQHILTISVCLVMMRTHHYRSPNHHTIRILACQLLVVLTELLQDKVSGVSRTV